MKFTAFLNSRGRPTLLQNALQSLYSTCSNIDNLECLVRVDNDDTATSKQMFEPFYPNLKFIEGERPDNLIKSYNELVSAGAGDLFWSLNDDIQILTPNWDILIGENIKKFQSDNNIKDNIFLCATADTSVDKSAGTNYSSFVLISKEAVETLGYFMNEKFRTLGGDSHICRIYSEVNRIVDCNNVLLDHIFHNDVYKVMNPDLTAAEYRQKAWSNSPDPFTLDITEDVNKLKAQLK